MDDVLRAVLDAIEVRDWTRLRRHLHPYVQWHDASGLRLRGRSNAIAFLRTAAPPEPPASCELRDGQVYRWHA